MTRFLNLRVFAAVVLALGAAGLAWETADLRAREDRIRQCMTEGEGSTRALCERMDDVGALRHGSRMGR